MSNLLFSVSNRKDFLQQMASNPLDVLVIGGGITGAGIALDASARGLNIGLVEMNDFASGTSSRSTKLVHGGLRYLKQAEVKLVKEVGRERALLHRNAPHLVTPAPMLLPIYKKGSMGYFTASIGLSIYDRLAGVMPKERRVMFRKEKTEQMEPLLRKDHLVGSGYYYEYMTDDARLTLEVLKTAHAQGAKLVNYAKVADFIYEAGVMTGVIVLDGVSGEQYEIYAHKIVNAAGPWVDELRKADKSLKGKKLLLTKGVHLVFDRRKLPVSQSIYCDTPDGRMVFIIPRGEKTYVGTTDTVYEGNIAEPRTTSQDRDYLLNAVNSVLPSVNLKAEDVESNWAGLRPLIYEEGKGPSEVSRKDEIFVSQSGMITIAGGKLTGFRKMAEKVVDLVARQLSDETGRKFPDCATDRITISGGDHTGYPTFDELKEQLMGQGRGYGFSPQSVQYLLSVYGANAVFVYSMYRELPQGGKTDEERLLYAELLYNIDHEMTVNAVDFLVRRSALMLFDIERMERVKQEVVEFMGIVLGWTPEEEQRQMEMVQKELYKVKFYQ